jgi:hypothetical protein
MSLLRRTDLCAESIECDACVQNFPAPRSVDRVYVDALVRSLPTAALSRPFHLSRVHGSPVADEATGFQALRPDTESAAIEVQHADLRASAVDEKIQPTVQWILSEPLPNKVSAIHRTSSASTPVGEHQHRCSRILSR